MKNRESTSDQVPGICGLGCWAFGGKDWGYQDPKVSLRTIKSAFDNGITLFDTAQSYGNGLSEQLLGKALKHVRDRVFISTKAAYRPSGSIRKAVEKSLRRLKTDYIDLFYIHWPRTGADLADCMEGLMRVKEEGKIGKIGVSNFSVNQMKEVMQAGHIDTHQLCYNLLWRREEKEVIPFCSAHGIGVVTYSTLAQGILTGKFTRDLSFETGDHRKSTLFFEPDFWPVTCNCVDQLRSLSDDSKRPLLQIAIQWVMQKKFISSALVGARNENQVYDLVQTVSDNIDPEVLKKAEKVSDSFQEYIPDVRNIFRYSP
ncbi:aldo/keto reductase [Chitinispirillum alkaliphilum]|nr:aldo/keto reductase [Chitinispirillum alkaliphilum]